MRLFLTDTTFIKCGATTPFESQASFKYYRGCPHNPDCFLKDLHVLKKQSHTLKGFHMCGRNGR